MRRAASGWALTLVGLAMPAGGLAQTIVPGTVQPVAAVPADPPSQQASGRGGLDVLIRQAERWLSQDRADLAAISIERALAADPRNTNALAVAARVEAARGDRGAVTNYLARLRAAGGTDEQRAQADNAVRGASVDRVALDTARQLARDGKAAEAAARYRNLFGPEGPPEQFALEYYQALAGTDAGAEEGRRGLGRIAGRQNADPRARLAYAQTLTYQPSTRSDGVQRLAELADQPTIGADARRAWRQALIWSLGDSAAAPQVDSYLQRFPDDADLRRRIEAARAMAPATAPDPGFTSRRDAFAQLESGSLRNATRGFEDALVANPNDADALGGLGLVRLREGKQAEARTLLERAIALDPARAPQWQRALDGASYGAELAEGRALLRANKLDEADQVLRRAVRREAEDKTDAETLLGELALRRADPAAAEQRFRTALARRPGFAPAQTGLNQALRALGRSSEIVAVAAPRVANAADAQVSEMRAEAGRSGDPAVATAILRNAVSIAPSDPWVRLDLARSLRSQGRAGEGRALVEELTVRSGSADSNLAAALYADEDNRPADVEAILNRIPPSRRSPDMARLQQRARTQAEIAQASAKLRTGVGESRQQLLLLAARPDPSGATAAAVIRAFADADDRFGAAEAGRIGQAVNRSGGARAQIAIAGALLAAGLDAEAAALADAADQPSLGTDQRRDLASLRTGIAVRATDRFNEAGDQAQGFERLRPALAANPDDPKLRLALARLYQGASRPTEALRITEQVLARDPRNLDARRSAVDAAIAVRDRERAEALVAEGLALAPHDSRATVLEARVARAFGQDSRARRALETASLQRQQELGRPALVAQAGGTVPPSFPEAENPFARGGITTKSGQPRLVALPSDPVARDIAAQLAAIDDQNATRMLGTVGGRARSGSSGLDRLQEISGSLQVSVAPDLIGGRLSAAISPVSLDAGKLGSDPATRRRFGSNLIGSSAATSSTTASGVGLALAYSTADWLKVDVGTTPIGFHSTNIIGGVELAPAVSDNLRLRFTAERRAITDSLLSWAGVRDPVQGRYWGGVTRTGGRGQVEIPIGRGYLYAGGGYSQYQGDQVASNTRTEAGAGVGYPIIRDGDTELTTGLDLVYFSFDKNLRYFTFGQGGYYSPQSYAAINIPLDYKSRIGDFSYRVGGTLGYVNWREDASNYFPNNPNLQAQAEVLAPNGSTSTAQFPGQSHSGVIGGLRADLDYALTPQLSIGGAFRYDKAANFDETRMLLRLNNRF